jgi:glycosyltransferase XagB
VAYQVADGAVIGRPAENDWATASPSNAPTFRLDPADAPPLDSWAPGPNLPHCPEIDCVRRQLPPVEIALAELRAAEVEVGADQVLVAEGVISEEDYVMTLAVSLGMVFEWLENRPRDQCPLPDDRMLEAATTGMLPLTAGDGVDIVVAPLLVDSRRLVTLAQGGTDITRRIRLTTAARLQRFVAIHGSPEIGRRASGDLRLKFPQFSAGTGRSIHVVVALLAGALALAAFGTHGGALMATEIVLGAVFLAWTGLRVFGLLSERLVRRKPHAFSDSRLPVYSIVVALYREAAAVRDLVSALRGLNYPVLGSKLT